MHKLITGNEAVALGALAAGVRVVSGYPGTPSTGALESLLRMDLPGRHVEWSVNEKVALEIAGGVAWAGHRSLCTMKMSGLNVAYDSLISFAYSGCEGGFVIYVADDPGASAGMCEQDSRGFALMSDMVMLDPSTVAEAYTLTQYAFELSEQIKTPVFVRLVTALANSFATVQVGEPAPVSSAAPILTRDIARYTKAGAAVVMAQHRELIRHLEEAGRLIAARGLNTLTLSPQPGGLGVIASGVAASYLQEGLELLAGQGLKPEALSVLKVVAPSPFPAEEVRRLLNHCASVVVLEELEPHVEKNVYVEAQRLGYRGRILGKLDGTFGRIGEYGVPEVVRGIAAGAGVELPAGLFQGGEEAGGLAAARPITTCAGCPHRGTYLAINRALRRLRLKRDQVMVTGDIGCTILGMNPPFDTVWNEVSMGASVGLAQGFVHAGVETPVIATIGDSTFFHAGIPGLINAVQHQVPLTLIIMDNGWTAMTGMQVNPGTGASFQKAGSHTVDIARLVPALGVEQFFVIDPYDLAESTATIEKALTLPGVKVVLARRECAIQALRRGERAGTMTVNTERCNLCKQCIAITGCAAISLGEKAITIDPSLCSGCGLCAAACSRDAIAKGPVA